MSDEGRARELLARPDGDTQLDWPICDTDQMCENCQRLVQTIAAALSAARAEGEAAGRAALQVKLATAIQNCQLHRDDPEADESYFDSKERAYQNVLAWLREADRRPPIGPRG